MSLILTINSGSSSVKYQCFEMEGEVCLARGQVDRLDSSSPNLFYERHDGTIYQIDMPQMDYEKVFHLIFATLLDKERGILQELDGIVAVGHRVVHGGSHFAESTAITAAIEAVIDQCTTLAPLHNPYNLEGIRVCREVLPNIPHVAVFDTAFHQTIPDYAYLYALPYSLYEQHAIRRYGFHGTSHRYVSARAAEILGRPLASLKLISCHLGNGCSITAIDQGKSIDTSMGFTPLEGLMMGTRCGDIDPAIIFYLMDERQMSAEEVNQMLNRNSGLLGVSGLGSDVRDLFHAVSEGNPQAVLALKMFCYRVSQYIGKYAAVLGGVDALIFTAGIGENASRLRAKICEKLGFMGIYLDERNNRSSGIEKAIHGESASIPILVIPTNEELMIARDTLRWIEADKSTESPYAIMEFTRLKQLVEQQADPTEDESTNQQISEPTDRQTDESINQQSNHDVSDITHVESPEYASTVHHHPSTQYASKLELDLPDSHGSIADASQRFHELINTDCGDTTKSQIEQDNDDTDTTPPVAPPAWVSIYDKRNKK